MWMFLYVTFPSRVSKSLLIRSCSCYGGCWTSLFLLFWTPDVWCAYKHIVVVWVPATRARVSKFQISVYQHNDLRHSGGEAITFYTALFAADLWIYSHGSVTSNIHHPKRICTPISRRRVAALRNSLQSLAGKIGGCRVEWHGFSTTTPKIIMLVHWIQPMGQSLNASTLEHKKSLTFTLLHCAVNQQP